MTKIEELAVAHRRAYRAYSETVCSVSGTNEARAAAADANGTYTAMFDSMSALNLALDALIEEQDRAQNVEAAE